MKSKYCLFVIIVSFFCCSCNNYQPADWHLTSPNGKITTTIVLRPSGKLTYSVLLTTDSLSEQQLIESSPLGIVRTDQRFDSLKFIAADNIKTVDKTYIRKTGKRLKNKNYYNELTLHFENSNKAQLDIVFRAYHDGVAFKYIFPEHSTKKYTVTHELSGFNLPKGQAWMQPYDVPSDYAPAYERYFQGPVAIGSSSPGKEGWCFPALFEINHHWLLLSESNLKDNFYGSHLNAKPDGGHYRVVPPEAGEASGYGISGASSSLPWDMPWRVIMVGNHLGDIVESNLVSNLADPSRMKDTSWIIPGRASWAWWSGYLDGTTDTQKKLKKFIDLAHAMKWEYSMIDAGWKSRKGVDIRELVSYARQRNVKLLLWYNSGGPNNKVNAGPKGYMNDPVIRRKEMKRIADLGIKGIKIDFFCSDKQDFIKLYHGILRDAARYKLMVDFHGCTIPRGWSRTYPNLMSSEAVVGEEGYIYRSDYRDKAPLHNTILPFTRNVVGSMDYTPVAFSFQKNSAHKTSFAFELALSVVFESGIQHFADKAEVYLGLPLPVNRFLQEVPTAWDATKFLAGYPGKEVVLARRKDDVWYVGGINGEDKSKEVGIDFGFLTPGVNYSAQLITDGKDTKSFASTHEMITAKMRKTINMLPVGGFVMRLSPSK